MRRREFFQAVAAFAFAPVAVKAAVPVARRATVCVGSVVVTSKKWTVGPKVGTAVHSGNWSFFCDGNRWIDVSTYGVKSSTTC